MSTPEARYKLTGASCVLIGAFLMVHVFSLLSDRGKSVNYQIINYQLDDYIHARFVLAPNGHEWRLESDAATFPLGCEEFESLVNDSSLTYIGSGWTKAVYSATLKHNSYKLEKPAARSTHRMVALKMVNLDGYDMRQCILEFGGLQAKAECYKRVTRKLLKELVLVYTMSHPNIVKVLGYCIPFKSEISGRHSVLGLITELGEPLDVISYLGLPWQTRIQLLTDILNLIIFLDKNHHLPSVLADAKMEQFALFSDRIKLIDLDDLRMRSEGEIPSRRALVELFANPDAFVDTPTNLQPYLGSVLGHLAQSNTTQDFERALGILRSNLW